MANTNNRLQGGFAGLHNVQRFANRPNNPFPNLGYNRNTPRRGGIGPLRDYEARNLVQQPFNLLGFKFEPLVVDKILSYTNRHPSLIQFFCHELIRAYRRSNADRNPPFEIDVENVDRVLPNTWHPGWYQAEIRGDVRAGPPLPCNCTDHDSLPGPPTHRPGLLMI